MATLRPKSFSFLLKQLNLVKSVQCRMCVSSTNAEMATQNVETPKSHSVSSNLMRNQASFASILKSSKFIDMGSVEGRVVKGTIFEVEGQDLYIDYGGKFHCVCTLPANYSLREKYHRGAQVRIKLHDLELSSRFLGAVKDLTLLEADATLLGLISKRRQ